jgi:thioredoxin-like negative regulator of GroEL
MTKVIKFYADWCGPCRIYAKTFDKISEELKEQVEFVNVNVEKDTTGLAGQYKVTGIPMTVVIKDGQEKSKTGRMDEETLKNFILNE